ncbi:unnamed protein product [Triticum turgidum subsp. durum]|uniref:ABC1 atypical kinase-like domain-containing protein n=1 Tax=Triticum turgidum subsp. durum TaxID=4567 RepID=A0A9R1QVE1_TRITD|nr:unnamed protein product [Triticum turgidum subsp. durum]
MRASMLKRCPVSSYEDVLGVFKKEIGELPQILASASLAQVHAATTRDGKKSLLRSLLYCKKRL